MNSVLSSTQVESYQRDGFVLHPQFLTAAEVAELKAAVLESVETMGRKKVGGDVSGGWEEGESYYDKVFTQRLNLWRINSTVKRYMLNPELGHMLCRLAGVKAMRVWLDQTLIKEPFANPTSWHLDNPYWSFFSPDAISIWIALEDATPQNGCLYFLPGSQKLATYQNVGIGENMADLFKAYPKMAAIDSIGVPMKAGDCSFHNGLCAHAAGPNMTRHRRIAMTGAYMPDGSTFNGNRDILPETYFKSLSPGAVLANDDWNPRL